MTSNDLKAEVSEAAETAKQKVTSAMDAAAKAGQTAQAEVKARASEAFETVRDAAGEHASSARDTLVGAGDRLAETLESEAQSADGMPARVLHGLAGGVTSVTDGLRGRTFGDVLAGAQDYARRHPGTFAVGAAVAGFALARFLSSSASRHDAEARAAEMTDRIYRDAARRTVDTQGLSGEKGARG